jgi:hypothetical protein
MNILPYVLFSAQKVRKTRTVDYTPNIKRYVRNTANDHGADRVNGRCLAPVYPEVEIFQKGGSARATLTMLHREHIFKEIQHIIREECIRTQRAWPDIL